MYRNKKYLIVTVIGFFFLCFLIGPKYNIKTVDLANKFQGISAQHWMGTDNLGRDVFSLVAAGGIRTLLVTVIGLTVSFVLGSFLGTAEAFSPPWLKSIIQFLSDFTLIIPSFMLALVCAAVFGFNHVMIGVVLGIGNMGDYVNQSYDLTKTVKKEDYIQGELLIGAKTIRIISMHIFPNIARELLVFMGNHVSSIIIQYAGLAYIGLGTDYTNPDWGTLLYQYRAYLTTYPQLVFWPAASICLMTLISHWLFDDGKNRKRSVIGYD